MNGSLKVKYFIILLIQQHNWQRRESENMVSDFFHVDNEVFGHLVNIWQILQVLWSSFYSMLV